MQTAQIFSFVNHWVLRHAAAFFYFLANLNTLEYRLFSREFIDEIRNARLYIAAVIGTLL
jgi:hypothetical protein